MKNEQTGLWKGLPGWARGVIVVIILLVIVLIAYKLYKFIIDRAGASQGEDVRDTQKDLNDLIKQGIKPSYPQSQYSNWAESLRTSFDGCGTDNGAWQRIFKDGIKNKADVLSLNASYGIRTYDACGIGTGDTTLTLPAAITDELSSSDIGQINTWLSQKSITYQY
jgi:hypothetical protein